MQKHAAGISIVLLFLFQAGSFAGEENESFGLLIIESPGPVDYVSVEVDLESLRNALHFDDNVAALSPPRAFLEEAGRISAPVMVQAVPESSNAERLVLALPDDAPRPVRVRLYCFGKAPDIEERPGHDEPLDVERKGGCVIVNNGHAQVVHDPAVQAGLPSGVIFAGTGARLEGLQINDRVHDPELGSFFLRSDTQATVRVVYAGPLETEIEVSARYGGQKATTPSNPRAVYRFRYRAGSPAIEVRSRHLQDKPFAWKELHLMEWNISGRPLPQWAIGKPRDSGVFDKDKQSIAAGQWGCLSNGTDVLGIGDCYVKLYSGNGYGSYIHGPWVNWGSVDKELSCTVWLDSSDGAQERLADYAHKPTAARLTTPEIERQRAAIAKSIRKLEHGALRGLHQWWFAMADRLLAMDGDLDGALAALAEQASFLAKETGSSEMASHLRKRIEENEQRVALRNSDLLFILGKKPEGFRPCSMFSLTAEREFLSAQGPPLWALTAEDAEGETYDWSSATNVFDGRITIDGNTARAMWRGRDVAAGLNVAVDFELRGPSVAGRLRIDNGSEKISIMRIRFPELALCRIGEDAADDAYLRPEVSGIVTESPLTKGLNSNVTYPGGWGSFQCSAHYDNDAGVYVGIHDPVASTKRFEARTGDDFPESISVCVEWPAPDASRPGNDFEQPGEMVLTTFEGNWFDASRLYRQWVSAEAEWWPENGRWGREDTAGWFEDIAVWALASGGPGDVVEPTKLFAEFMGVPTAVHWYSWHQVPFDDDYPHYFPVKEGFAQGVAELQEAGVRVMPYINGRLWDSDTDDFESVALPAATKKRNGDYYVEVYGSGEKLVPMCPTQRMWQDKVCEIVLRLMSPEFNVDGVYIDQVAAATPRECYDADHGHPLAGGHWWTTDGYWPMLTRLNKEIDRKYDGKFLTTECNGEPYVHLFDGYLTWHFQNQDMVPFYAAVYGGKIQSFGRAFRGDDQLAHRMKMAQALAFGEQLGWINPQIVEQQPETAAYLRRCARIRYTLRSHLAKGYMARPPKITGDNPQITADWAWHGEWPITDSAIQRSAWRAEDESVAFVFANATEKELPFTWHFDGAQYGFDKHPLEYKDVREADATGWKSISQSFKRAIKLEPLQIMTVVVRRQ